MQLKLFSCWYIYLKLQLIIDLHCKDKQKFYFSVLNLICTSFDTLVFPLKLAVLSVPILSCTQLLNWALDVAKYGAFLQKKNLW